MPDHVRERLNAEAELSGVSTNTLIAKIVTRHVEWDRFVADTGFVVSTKPFLRALLQEAKEERIKELASTVCKAAFRDAIIFIHGELNFHNTLRTMDQWLLASNIPFRHVINKSTCKYVVQHDLGMKWTLYFLTLLNSMLNEFGYKTNNVSANAQSISLEIQKVS